MRGRECHCGWQPWRKAVFEKRNGGRCRPYMKLCRSRRGIRMHSCWKKHQKEEETKIPLVKESGFADKGVGMKQRYASFVNTSQPNPQTSKWCSGEPAIHCQTQSLECYSVGAPPRDLAYSHLTFHPQSPGKTWGFPRPNWIRQELIL